MYDHLKTSKECEFELWLMRIKINALYAPINLDALSTLKKRHEELKRQGK
jgi:hypothetical protein